MQAAVRGRGGREISRLLLLAEEEAALVVQAGMRGRTDRDSTAARVQAIDSMVDRVTAQYEADKARRGDKVKHGSVSLRPALQAQECRAAIEAAAKRKQEAVSLQAILQKVVRHKRVTVEASVRMLKQAEGREEWRRVEVMQAKAEGEKQKAISAEDAAKEAHGAVLEARRVANTAHAQLLNAEEVMAERRSMVLVATMLHCEEVAEEEERCVIHKSVVQWIGTADSSEAAVQKAIDAWKVAWQQQLKGVVEVSLEEGGSLRPELQASVVQA